MKTTTYPSEIIPATRGFSIDGPDDWVLDCFPGALLVLAEPKGEGFRANVLVEVTRTTADTTLETITIEEDEDSPILRKETAEISGEPGLLVVRGERSPDWPEPLVRWQLVVVAGIGHASLRDLFVFTATCEAADADRYADVFEGIVTSLRLDPL